MEPCPGGACLFLKRKSKVLKSRPKGLGLTLKALELHNNFCRFFEVRSKGCRGMSKGRKSMSKGSKGMSKRN